MSDQTPADSGGPDRTSADSGPPRPPRRPALSARAAAGELGVNERTIRRWIDQGQLAAVKIRGSYRITVEEIERARVAVLGEDLNDVIEMPTARTEADTSGNADMPGHARSAADTAAAAGTAPGTPTISPAARSQLEAIRDEWLRPIMERNEELARENGRLQERVIGVERERDAALAEIERLRAAHDAPPTAPEPQHEARPAEPASDTSAPWWRLWDRWG
ncbi:MAG: helix-turn-helix domain-containing protein [Chloroflexota bacterium]|nr:helix-turn-helix domain-containing protein [Chloroflexota bacterium]MDP9472674.1 helix-turn-helix domain-containing protein [Chloroflexota bacterium]